MHPINSLIKELETAPARIERSVRVAVTRTGAEWQTTFKSLSPVKMGHFRHGWRLGRAKSSQGEIASISLFNNEPHALAIEAGVNPSSNSHPWAISIRNQTSKNVRLKNGRVWSSSAVGGVSSSISKSAVRDLTRNVANAIIAGLNRK